MTNARATVALTPLKGGAPCSIQFDEEVLSLRADDDRVLMMLPRDDAALHIKFDWRLPYGPVVSFVVVEGLRAYHYRASREATRALLDWLPLRTEEALANELRWHGVGVVLLGVAMLLFPHAALWPLAGVAVALAGCLSVLRTRRNQYAVNATLFAALGLGLLFAPPWIAPPETTFLWPTLFGGLLVVWGIQQAALMSPQHLMDQSRANQSAPRRMLRRGSRVHTVLATITLGCALPLAALAWQNRADFSLLLSYSALAVVTIGIASAIVLRGRQSYRELQLGGQWIVLILYFLTYGLIWHAAWRVTDPAPYPLGPIYNFHLPYVSLPLLALVVLFNVLLRRVIRARLALEDDE